MSDDITFTFTFMHLADAFIQSDLHCIQVTVFTFFNVIMMILSIMKKMSHYKSKMNYTIDFIGRITFTALGFEKKQNMMINHVRLDELLL